MNGMFVASDAPSGFVVEFGDDLECVAVKTGSWRWVQTDDDFGDVSCGWWTDEEVQEQYGGGF